MATFDLTRSIFEPRKRYAGVRMQQGRVVLDDDHNEAGDLAAEDTQRTNRDVIGPSGSPDDGFKITTATTAAGVVDFVVHPGTMYVGGVPVRLHHGMNFSRQPDWVCMADADRLRTAGSTRDLVYLEVWRQPVSAEEDRELVEPALGAPDTTTRLRTMARVRRRSVTADSCTAAWAEVTAQLGAAGLGVWNADTCEVATDVKLAVDYLVGGVPDDLCSPSVTAGYLGAENQAICVQLLERLGPTGTGELTWGFDNAAPLYRARIISPTEIELLTPPRDEAHWPIMQQTVEVLPWSAVLVPGTASTPEDGEILADGGGRGSPTPQGRLVSIGGGHFSRLASSYDPTTQRITLSAGLPAAFNTRAAAHVAAGVDTDHAGDDRSEVVFVRLWNRGSDLGSAARIPWTSGSALTLGNTGLQVTITGSALAADAHWIIAARPNTPDQVLPWSLEVGREPNGVRRYLVPLAVVAWAGNTGVVHDCRETFRPLTRQRSCCRYTVGDGERSHGDFTSIQDAVDNLPMGGGTVCVLAGTYTEEVMLDGLTDVTIHGCGAASIVRVAAPAEAVVTIRDCQRITLCDIRIQTDEGWGVRVEDASDVELADLEVFVRDRGAVFATGVAGFELRDSVLGGGALIADPQENSVVGRLPLVFAQGTGIRIRENRILAADPKESGASRRGGIQIGGDSSDVTIENNLIAGGNGNGITLGSVTTDTSVRGGWLIVVEYWYWDGNCLRKRRFVIGLDGKQVTTVLSAGPLELIRIWENRILRMAGDGIGVAWFFDEAKQAGVPQDFITVRQLRVVRNHISACETAEREAPDSFLAKWSGHGGIALADVEDGLLRDNEIRDNGVGVPDPVCGIFVLNSEGIVIDRNRVTNNGRTAANRTGWLGGIVLPTVSPNYGGKQAWDGRASARVVDNTVMAPEGPALISRVTRGTILVERNELTTFTTMGELTSQGPVVDIVNGGFFSEDFLGHVSFESTSSDKGGQIVFSNNVVTWQPSELSGFGLWSVRLVGFDDVTSNGNVGRIDIGSALFFFDWMVFGITAHIADNRLRETPLRAFLSLASIGLMNVTTDNATTHCVIVYDDSTIGAGVNNRSFIDQIAPTWCGNFVTHGQSANAATPQATTIGPMAQVAPKHGQFATYQEP